MGKGLSPAGRKALFRFGVLFLAAVVLQGLTGACFLLEGEAGVGLYLLCSLGLLPVLSVLLPFWAGLGGVHPMAACLPLGSLPLIFSTAPVPWVPLACVPLSLIAAVAGQEWKKRKETEEKKGHGRRDEKKKKT